MLSSFLEPSIRTQIFLALSVSGIRQDEFPSVLHTEASSMPEKCTVSACIAMPPQMDLYYNAPKVRLRLRSIASWPFLWKVLFPEALS